MAKGNKKSVLAHARLWATKHKLFGTQAFLRYVIFRFAENLNQVSDDFVFKGGNLLWVYIATPRATTDLDLATLKIDSHLRVREVLERACVHDAEIRYSLLDFKQVEQEGKSGAEVTVGYATDQGATNRFEVDVVYALVGDSHEIESPVNTKIKIRSATLENIIADKIAASHRFKSGNTRMKDYDDLWRLSKSGAKISATRLKKLLRTRSNAISLDPEWISADAERAWKSHSSKYEDLPESLKVLFGDVNKWLRDL